MRLLFLINKTSIFTEVFTQKNTFCLKITFLPSTQKTRFLLNLSLKTLIMHHNKLIAFHLTTIDRKLKEIRSFHPSRSTYFDFVFVTF